MGRTWTWSHWRQRDAETERQGDTETGRQGDREAVTENSKWNQQQQHSDHHREGKKSTELKTNWLQSKQSRYRSKYSWAEILRVTRRHNGALYGHIWGGGGSLYISLPMFGNIHKNKHNKPVLAKEMENGDIFSERKQMALKMQCKIIINKYNFSGKKK